MCLCMYFVTLSILQSQFIEKGFKKAENSEQNVVLLLFLFTLHHWDYMTILFGLLKLQPLNKRILFQYSKTNSSQLYNNGWCSWTTIQVSWRMCGFIFICKSTFFLFYFLNPWQMTLKMTRKKCASCAQMSVS